MASSTKLRRTKAALEGKRKGAEVTNKGAEGTNVPPADSQAGFLTCFPGSYASRLPQGYLKNRLRKQPIPLAIIN